MFDLTWLRPRTTSNQKGLPNIKFKCGTRHVVSGSMVWCWECGWWLETHLQRVASAFGIIVIYTVRVHNAKKNDELDDMHHGTPRHDCNVAHCTPHTRNCCGSTHICGKSPHVHALTPLEWSGRSAHVGQVQGGSLGDPSPGVALGP